MQAIALAGLGGLACGEVERARVDARVDDPVSDAMADASSDPVADAAIDAIPFVCTPSAPVGGIPASTTKPGWGISQGSSGSNDTGSTPGVLVIGDSLVANIGTPIMANAVRFFLGTDAVVVAASGASVAHFNSANLIAPSGLSTIEQYVRFFNPVRITVLALSSNDARLITQERGQAGAYTIDEFAHQIDVAIAAALMHSQCVVLINVADHWDVAASEIVNQVNGVLGCAGTGNPRVRTADWNGFSAPHPEWFASPTDIHHSEAGRTAFRDFVVNAAGAAFAVGC